MVITLLVAEHRTDWLDLPIIHIVQGSEQPVMTRVAQVLAFIGSVVPLIVICIILALIFYFLLGFRAELLLMFSVMIGSPLWNSLLKWQFQRARPEIYRLAEATGYSYPSGHAMSAFSLYGVLAYLLWKHVPSSAGRSILLGIVFTIILATGLSRIYLGVHYPSDVLGGYFAATFWLTLCIAFYERRLRTKLPKSS